VIEFLPGHVYKVRLGEFEVLNEPLKAGVGSHDLMLVRWVEGTRKGNVQHLSRATQRQIIENIQAETLAKELREREESSKLLKNITKYLDADTLSDFTLGFLAARCVIQGNVSDKRYDAFAERYTLVTGNDVPEEYFNTSEKKWGHALAVLFHVTDDELNEVDFAEYNLIEPERDDDERRFRIFSVELVWELFGKGFRLGKQDQNSIRLLVQDTSAFDAGVSLGERNE